MSELSIEGPPYPFVATWSTVGSVVVGGDGFKIIECKCPRDATDIAERRNKEMQDVMMKWPLPNVTGCGAAPKKE